MKVKRNLPSSTFSESDWLQSTLDVLRLPRSNGRNVITSSASGNLLEASRDCAVDISLSRKGFIEIRRS